MKRFLYLGLLALLSLGSVASQTPERSPADSAITEKETAEIRAFTKDFVWRLRKTRDIRPLVPKYFAKDFETFLYHFMLSESASGSNVRLPDPPRRKRVVLAAQNYLAVLAPYTVITLDLEKELPPRLRRRYERFNASLDGASDEAWLTDKRVMLQVESLTRAVATHLRSHPIEKTVRYKAELKKREMIDDYNYSIITNVPDQDLGNDAARWLRSQPDAKTYMVGTPVGLAVGIIQSGGQYKVLYLYPWPISYDGRLN